MESHRASSLFEISKNWASEPLDSYQKMLNFVRSTRTQTGLSVTAHLDRRYYPTGAEPTTRFCPSGTNDLTQSVKLFLRPL
jgi:hypothetical protein